jgi:hypothetical protein
MSFVSRGTPILIDSPFACGSLRAGCAACAALAGLRFSSRVLSIFSDSPLGFASLRAAYVSFADVGPLALPELRSVVAFAPRHVTPADTP